MNIRFYIFTLRYFILSVLVVGCGIIKSEVPKPGIDNPLKLGEISIQVVDARIRPNYSTNYIMHYPPEAFTFYTITTSIEGFDDPKSTLEWGKANLRLIGGEGENPLAYAHWIITGDDVEYKVDYEFEYQYVFFYIVPEEVDYTAYHLQTAGDQVITTSAILITYQPLLVSQPEPETSDGEILEITGDKGTLGENAALGGGLLNISGAYHTTVGGGYQNYATVAYATISGGRENQATQLYTTICGGYANQASGRDAVVAGGSRNSASNYHATVGGGIRNQASATDATIAGGGYNKASDTYATVSGGTQNTASGSGAVVGGGAGNTASQNQATVSGGLGNLASGIYSTVSGGEGNLASGGYSTIPGGQDNQAQGEHSLAAGHRAVVAPNHPGTFLFADSLNLDFTSEAKDEFGVRASGGVRFVTAVDEVGKPVSGVILSPGSGSWATLSDRGVKENITSVDRIQILESLAALPITEWNYANQNPSIRHIGPMAQDFFAAFGTGEDSKHINIVDSDGVALAAIQGLLQIVEDQDAQIAALESKITTLEKRESFTLEVQIIVVTIALVVVLYLHNTKVKVSKNHKSR